MSSVPTAPAPPLAPAPPPPAPAAPAAPVVAATKTKFGAAADTNGGSGNGGSGGKGAAPKSMADELKRFHIASTTKERTEPQYIALPPPTATATSAAATKTKSKTVRIIAVSDIHMNHKRLVFPPSGGDSKSSAAAAASDSERTILVVSGDMTCNGTINELRAFNEWLGVVKSKYELAAIVVIAGNHESCLFHPSFMDPTPISGAASASGGGAQHQPTTHTNTDPYTVQTVGCAHVLKTVLTHATHYLMNTGCVIEGIKFYGIPHVPNMSATDPHAAGLDNTEFYMSESKLASHIFNRIPTDVTYLITHTPPLSILDVHSLGSSALYERITKHCPKLRVNQFGHVHGGYGFKTIGQTLFVNAAVDDTEQPFVFHFPVDA